MKTYNAIERADARDDGSLVESVAECARAEAENEEEVVLGDVALQVQASRVHEEWECSLVVSHNSALRAGAEELPVVLCEARGGRQKTRQTHYQIPCSCAEKIHVLQGGQN